MSTILKTPITITIRTTETAVAFAMFSRGDIDLDKTIRDLHPNIAAIAATATPWPDPATSISAQIDTALKAQGVDWNTWKPEPPLTIGGHEVIFNADGSAKIGCTTVTPAEIDAFVKRRPKANEYLYWRSGDVVYRAVDSSELGEYFRDGKWIRSIHLPALGNWPSCERITRDEAAARICAANV